MRFIGLDLDWSRRHLTGAVALEGDGTAFWLVYCDSLREDAELVEFVRATAASGSAPIAIGAPLIVPNAEGSRPVDREITDALAATVRAAILHSAIDRAVVCAAKKPSLLSPGKVLYRTPWCRDAKTYAPCSKSILIRRRVPSFG